MSLPAELQSVISPCKRDAVPKLLAEVAEAGDTYSKVDACSHAERLALLKKVQELSRALETPREIMIKDLWADPSKVMAVCFGIHTQLWKTMAKNGDGPQKVADLAKQINVQEELLHRMMQHVAAAGYLDLTAPGEYTPNAFSKSMALRVMEGSYWTGPPILNPTFLEAQDWLKNRNYTVPDSNLDTAYQIAHKTDMHWFAHMQSSPPHGENFNDHMFGYLLGRPAWFDIYPVQEKLIDGFDTADKDAVMMVDIAGGIGHYSAQFHAKYPDAPGRLVLEDLPFVINDIKSLSPKIEKVTHDMFTEQPIKGARAYFTHFVLHDWPDSDAIKIAEKVRDAMKPGYSKFLINEHVVPPMNQDYEQTALDLIMMTGFAGKERSAAQWSDLLEKTVGLKITNIYTGINGIESVVECMRPE